MASIRCRGKRWQARVIRQGYPDQVETFDSKTDAERWARQVEHEQDRGLFFDRTLAENTTLGGILRRYAAEVTPQKRGHRSELQRLTKMQRKRLPEKDDSFTLTSQVQGKDGWVLHPLHQQLAEQSANGKIRSIPVKLLFTDPELSLRSEYSLFDRNTGRPMCVGNGESCKHYTPEGLREAACPSPEGCDAGRKGGCKPYGRLNVQVEGQDDELASFIFRTTGFNSIRTLAARLRYFHAVSGGHAKHLPLVLKLRAKSTTQSHRAPVYYVDLCLPDGVSLESAVIQARNEAQGAANSLLQPMSRAELTGLVRASDL